MINYISSRSITLLKKKIVSVYLTQNPSRADSRDVFDFYFIFTIVYGYEIYLEKHRKKVIFDTP